MTYIIAEIGVNHMGDLTLAQQMVRRAAACGVNAVKFQSFTADKLVNPAYAPEQHQFFKRHELSYKDHVLLAKECKMRGVDFLSTPFDPVAVDMLDSLGVPAFKIASGDLTYLPLIRHAASKGKPLYISTGMGTFDEVHTAAVEAMLHGAAQVVLLQCTSTYPTKPWDVHLRAMGTMGFSYGYSDHTIGNYCCFAAAGMGAAVIEKHFCLDRLGNGPDLSCSAIPTEMDDLVRGIRTIENALGDPEKRRLDCEVEMVKTARRHPSDWLRPEVRDA